MNENELYVTAAPLSTVEWFIILFSFYGATHR